MHENSGQRFPKLVVITATLFKKQVELEHVGMFIRAFDIKHPHPHHHPHHQPTPKTELGKPMVYQAFDKPHRVHIQK